MKAYYFNFFFCFILFASADTPCSAQVPIKTKLSGKQLVDSLQKELLTMKDDSNKVKVLDLLGFEYRNIKPYEGIRYAQQALDLSEQLGWNKELAQANNCIGTNYHHMSDYPKALEYYFKALRLQEDIKNKNGIAGALSNIGNVYLSEHNYPKALDYYFRALKINEEIGNKKHTAVNLGNIGIVYYYQDKYPQALEYDQKAIKLFEEMGGNEEGIARNLSNISVVYQTEKNYSKSLEYNFKALKIDESLNNLYDMAAVLGNIGNAYFATTQDSNGIIKPDSLIPAGKNTRLLKSIAYLKKGVSMSKDVGDLDGVSVYSLGLVKAYKTLGDYKAALESYELYTASKDSVFSSDNNIKIANLETKRELELKDKQILLDKLEIKKKQNERIFFISVILLLLAVIAIVFRNLKLSVAKELSENKLNAFQARMNPHFIFNALNSIQSLMLQNETLLSIKYLSGFSKLMRQILDNSSKSRVLIDTEMEMLRTYIELEQLRFNCFAWKVDIAGNTAKNNLYVPPMIIQPFVENAIVHGILPKGKDGMLTISLERDNGHILCIVEDNGIGRQRSYELNREKHKGHESHGIDIATKRLTLLKGKKNGAGNSVIYVDKIENNIPTGTKVIIQIPIL